MKRRLLAGGLIMMLFNAAVTAAGGNATGFLDRTLTQDGHTHRYQVYVPADFAPDRAWPVILFLHGSGERGDDGLRQTQVGLPSAIRWSRERFAAIVVMPQLPGGCTWTGDMAAMAMATLETAVAEFHGDEDRLYLTGLSLGGYGTWLLAAEHPGKFAAIAPVCGGIVPPPGGVSSVTQLPSTVGAADPYAAAAALIGKTPTWIFHGADDPVIPPSESRRMAAALQAVGNEARFTEFPGVGHGAWDPAYGNAELWAWLFAQRRRD
jgi:predicted peptidase